MNMSHIGPFHSKIFFELLQKFQRSFKQKSDDGKVYDLHSGERFFSDFFTWMIFWLVVFVLNLFFRRLL